MARPTPVCPVCRTPSAPPDHLREHVERSLAEARFRIALTEDVLADVRSPAAPRLGSAATRVQ